MAGRSAGRVTVANVRQGAAAKTAADLLERGIEAVQGGDGWQQDVGIGEQGEGQQRARKAVDGGEFGYSEEGLQRLLHEAARSQGGAGHEGVDEAGNDEWQGHDDRPPAAAGKVRAREEPGDGHGQQAGDGGHCHHQQEASADDGEDAGPCE